MNDKVPVKAKLTVGKGLSIEVAKDRWRKVNYGLELELEIQTIEEVEAWKEKSEATIDGWISRHTGAVAPSPTPLIVTPSKIPDLDIREIQDAGWLTYQKNPCNPGQAGWVKDPIEFTSWKDPPQVLVRLSAAIRKIPEKKLVLGDMEYFLNKKFINRAPVKRESAR